jgi:predicted RecB family nuclease
MSSPILLTGYSAKQCVRRVHNEFDPTIETVEWEVPPELQMRFDEGIRFEADVFARLKEALPAASWVDVSDMFGKQAQIAATVTAMDDGMLVILGGWLPDDLVGGRAGKPDLLLRVGDGYVPGDVKAHQVTESRVHGELRYSLPSAPGDLLDLPGRVPKISARLDDHLQLAHYWRMLEAAGRLPAGVEPSGFIIGTDELDGVDDLALVWLDLTAPRFETFSRSSEKGKTKRSAMERYDHEFGFRAKVADVALQQDTAGAPAPLVQPVFTDECDSCPWLDFCLDLAGHDAASAHIGLGRLSIREWLALNTLGVSTIEQLAELDASNPEFQAAYLPEVTHAQRPLERLTTAIRRARMNVAGVVIERKTSGPIDLPRADVEIDFDIEWDTDDRVYLWGALVRRPGQDAAYVPFVSWDELDDAGARELALQFAHWLRHEIEVAAAAGQSLRVFHYSDPEPKYLGKVLGAEAVADLVDHFVDLLTVVRANYFGAQGLGIKKVAPEFGFHWRDEDPGGLQSQLWLLEARGSDDPAARNAARTRILEYNEDDVRATDALRAGMRAE